MASDLLLEIGVEELPASFVNGALAALPDLAHGALKDLRLSYGEVRTAGTPRRLAVLVNQVAERQSDLDEELVGPPARVAFDGEGRPTKAAESFANKLGCKVEDLTRVKTEKGEYVAGRRREAGRPASELLPRALARVCERIPFQKSMRWGDGDAAFGRPVRWLVALFGNDILPVHFAGLDASYCSQGHRFLSPGAIELLHPNDYFNVLREHHILVDVEERKRVMLEHLRAEAGELGGTLIEDEFLVEENSSLVETPHVVAGGFDKRFLELPERVILAVARGHQRYFGVRDKSGRLMPNYLAVVGTALKPENIRRGNDRVMRARLADAEFFYKEDRKTTLLERRPALDGIVFHKRLGSIGDKVRRLERLGAELGRELSLPANTRAVAEQGAGLCKCDLVTLMVGELPELQGEMGRAYALTQGVPQQAADLIAEHYQPRGAEDPTAPSDAGALVAIADRLDTLTGCFAVGLVPSGAADPLGLRRAAIGLLRTIIDKSWDISLTRAIEITYDGFGNLKLDLDRKATVDKLLGFLRHRLRGVLSQPADVVDACVAASFDRPYDVALRARALAGIAPEVRALAGEVFKRAANIAKDAPDVALRPPGEVQTEVPPAEAELFVEFSRLKQRLADSENHGDYASALGAIADFAPVLGKFFDNVFVMVGDVALRNNRLSLMRDVHATCSRFANFNLLAREVEEERPASADKPAPDDKAAASEARS